MKSDIEGYNKIGADGKNIYGNLSRLAATKKIVVRIPVIPGFNNNPGIMEGIAEFLRDNGIYEAYLLPFHRLGSGKYTALGLKYAFSEYQPIKEDEIVYLAEIFETTENTPGWTNTPRAPSAGSS